VDNKRNREKKMNVKIISRSMLIPAILCLGLLSGCTEEKQQAVMPQRTVEVDVISLQTQPETLEIELPGRTSAYRTAEVRPQVNGIIKKRLFQEGSEVTAGQLLYQIDPATYQAQYDSAKAALAKAVAMEKSTRLKAERYQNLVKTKAVSELDQVDAEATWQQAVADIAAAEAALNSARINLEYTKITAPISGRIGKSMITEGALVTAQQTTALAVILQLDPIYVDMTQSSTSMRDLKKNISTTEPENGKTLTPSVSILFENGDLYPHRGSLAFSDVTVEQSTGTVTLRAIVDNPEAELLPGMFVRAKIATGVKQNAIMVPAASISRNKKGQAVVMLVDAESKVESRTIEIGQTIGDKVMVNSGLSGNEKLIVAGLQNIKPGLTVKAVEAESSLATASPKTDTAKTGAMN
jgi:membrane fusion protein (multidrug efflux system)